MLGGIIASALGGAGGAVADMAGDQIKQDQRVALMREQEEMERRRAEYADQLSRSRAEWEVDTEGLGGKKVALDVKRTNEVGAAETAQQVARTEALIPAEVKREQTLAPVRQTNAVNQATAVKKAELETVNADLLAKGNNPEMLKALRNVAAAGESSATRASAALTQLSIDEKRQVAKLLTEYENPKTPEERRATITQSLIARGVLKSNKGETDTYTETTKTTDPETGQEKTVTQTKRRQPEPGNTARPAEGPQQSDVDYLKANPGKAAAFNGRFGAGAAERVLGGSTQQPAATGMGGMSDRELRQIAGIQGHARQQQAKDELGARAKREIDKRTEKERAWNESATLYPN
jgi:hypothetical protein